MACGPVVACLAGPTAGYVFVRESVIPDLYAVHLEQHWCHIRKSLIVRKKEMPHGETLGEFAHFGGLRWGGIPKGR